MRLPPRSTRTDTLFPYTTLFRSPTHRVFVGRAEIGAGWAKQSNEGRDYLSLKLDAPSFAAPIYANLFDDEDGDTFNLISSRNRATNGDCRYRHQASSCSIGRRLMLLRSPDFAPSPRPRAEAIRLLLRPAPRRSAP